jgi:hypothetical protein
MSSTAKRKQASKACLQAHALLPLIRRRRARHIDRISKVEHEVAVLVDLGTNEALRSRDADAVMTNEWRRAHAKTGLAFLDRKILLTVTPRSRCDGDRVPFAAIKERDFLRTSHEPIGVRVKKDIPLRPQGDVHPLPRREQRPARKSLKISL